MLKDRNGRFIESGDEVITHGNSAIVLNVDANKPDCNIEVTCSRFVDPGDCEVIAKANGKPLPPIEE